MSSIPLPAERDIEVYQGDNWALRFAVCETGTSTPKDVSASVIQMQIRKEPKSTTALLSLSSLPGEGIEFGVDDKITIKISAQQAADLPAGNWYYDIQQVDGSVTQTKLRGRCLVTAQVTR